MWKEYIWHHCSCRVEINLGPEFTRWPLARSPLALVHLFFPKISPAASVSLIDEMSWSSSAQCQPPLTREAMACRWPLRCAVPTDLWSVLPCREDPRIPRDWWATLHGLIGHGWSVSSPVGTAAAVKLYECKAWEILLTGELFSG